MTVVWPYVRDQWIRPYKEVWLIGLTIFTSIYLFYQYHDLLCWFSLFQEHRNGVQKCLPLPVKVAIIIGVGLGIPSITFMLFMVVYMFLKYLRDDYLKYSEQRKIKQMS